jgi:hypothetical protein
MIIENTLTQMGGNRIRNLHAEQPESGPYGVAASSHVGQQGGRSGDRDINAKRREIQPGRHKRLMIDKEEL